MECSFRYLVLESRWSKGRTCFGRRVGAWACIQVYSKWSGQGSELPRLLGEEVQSYSPLSWNDSGFSSEGGKMDIDQDKGSCHNVACPEKCSAPRVPMLLAKAYVSKCSSLCHVEIWKSPNKMILYRAFFSSLGKGFFDMLLNLSREIHWRHSSCMPPFTLPIEKQFTQSLSPQSSTINLLCSMNRPMI